MDFFQPITTNPNATSETLEKKRVAWNKGITYSNALKGSKKSPEHCANLSKSLTGRKMAPEARAKIGAANKGKPTWNKGRSWKKKPKAIMTPNGLINGGIEEIMKLSGAPYFTVYRWIKRWPEHYYYINKEITK